MSSNDPPNHRNEHPFTSLYALIDLYQQTIQSIGIETQHPGAIPFSPDELANRWGWTVSEVTQHIERWCHEHIISIDTSGTVTVLRVHNHPCIEGLGADTMYSVFPCECCRNMALRLIRVSGEEWAIFCPACKLSGPINISIKLACDSWNRLCGKMSHLIKAAVQQHRESVPDNPSEARKVVDILEIQEQKKIRAERDGDTVTISMDDYPEGTQVIEINIKAFAHLVQWCNDTLKRYRSENGLTELQDIQWPGKVPDSGSEE